MDNTKSPKTEEPEVPAEIKADLRRFNKAEEQVTKAVTALTAITIIANQEQLDAAMMVLSNSAKVEKLIEAKRVEMVKPFNDAVKKINTYAKELTGKLPPAITAAKNVVIAYNKEQQTRLENARKDIRGPQLLALGLLPSGDHYSYEGITIYNHSVIGLDDQQWIGFYSTTSAQIQQKKTELLQKLEKDADLNSAFGNEEDVLATSEKIEELKAPVPTAVNSFAGAGSVTSVKGITKTWTHAIVDESLIPREYLVVDTAKVTKAIREGVREIPGISIFQKEGLTVRSS